jgi:hypothetical protein
MKAKVSFIEKKENNLNKKGTKMSFSSSVDSH